MILNPMTVNFWLRRQRVCKRARSTNFGKCPVMYYVVASTGQRSQDVRLGYHCSPKDWDAGAWPKDVESAKNKLEEALRDINARYEQLNIPATGQMLLADYLNTNKPARYLLVVAQEWIESINLKQQRGGLSKTTASIYRTRLDNLTHYVENVLHRKTLTLHEINNAFVMDMEVYFRYHYRTRRCNRVGLGILTLKQQVLFLVNVMNFAQSRDYISQNPTSVYKVDVSKWQKKLTYLTEEELERFRTVDIADEKGRVAADIFLFLCETGLSYVDYNRMRDSWVQRLGDLPLPKDVRNMVNPNETWLINHRQKSKVDFAVPLSAEALRILKHYGGASLMPKMLDLNDLNIYVRMVAQLAGITKYLTSYVARKTFSHYWRNQSGLSSKAASRVMGHATDSAVNYYSSVQIESAVREVYQNR